jgi:hypothetical protein
MMQECDDIVAAKGSMGHGNEGRGTEMSSWEALNYPIM